MLQQSREHLYGHDIRSTRARPSRRLGEGLDAGYCYLEGRCLGFNTRQAFALDPAPTEDNADPRAGELHAV
jgi:hypothetical protein